MRTTKEFGESTVSKILELVENSSSRKSRSEAFISRFARVYTPAVCCGALALAFLPPIARILFPVSYTHLDVYKRQDAGIEPAELPAVRPYGEAQPGEGRKENQA